MPQINACNIFTRLCLIILLQSNLQPALSDQSSARYKIRKNKLDHGHDLQIPNFLKHQATKRSFTKSYTEKTSTKRWKAPQSQSKGEWIKRLKNDRLSRRYHVAGKDQMKSGLLQNLKPKKSIDQNSTKRHHLEDDDHLEHLDERPILGRCDINEQCKAQQYCQGIYCFKCRKELEHCFANGQCCQGMECQYGYCAKGISAGMPGTYCDKAKDCKGSDACCILEMSVDHHNAICKPMLEQHEICGPINLFHQITEYRAHNEPICGPCKTGLACKSIGINGHHSICLPEGAD